MGRGTIYKVPRVLHEQGLDGLICDKLRLNTPPANLKRWDDLVHETEHPRAKSPSPWWASAWT